MSPTLELCRISKSFPGTRALDQVSLTVNSGEIVVLVGENGAGKTTLMKILSGVWPQGSFEGEIKIRGAPVFFEDTKAARTAGIAMIHQELSVFPELSVGEHLELDQLPLWINWSDLHKRTQEFLDTLNFGLKSHTRVGDLSVGGRQLVEIARALYRKAEVLVFDEPTSALTESEVFKLYETIFRLRQEGRAIIYITHRMDEVFKLSDRIIVLRDGQKVGEISRVYNDTILSRKEIEPQLISWMVGRPIHDIYPTKNQDFGEELLRVENLSLWNSQGKKLIHEISFSLRKGQILGLAGLLGAGRSETLEALFGVFHETGTKRGYKTEGHLWIKGKRKNLSNPGSSIQTRMAFVSEDRKESGLVLKQSIYQNMILPSLSTGRSSFCPNQNLFSFVREKKSQTQSLFWMKELRMKATHLRQPVATLSGGTQQKVVLSKWLLTEPEILFLDEPTRGIDVGAKNEIYQWIQNLASQGMGILLASSEMPEILGISHQIIVLKEGKKSMECESNQLSQEDIMRAASL